MPEEKSTKHELLDALNTEFKDTIIEFELDTALNDPEIIIYMVKINNQWVKSIKEITERTKEVINRVISRFGLIAEFSDINTVFWVKL